MENKMLIDEQGLKSGLTLALYNKDDNDKLKVSFVNISNLLPNERKDMLESLISINKSLVNYGR